MAKYEIDDKTERIFYVGFGKKKYKNIDLNQNYEKIKRYIHAKPGSTMPYCVAVDLFNFAIQIQEKDYQSGKGFYLVYMYDENGNPVMLAHSPNQVQVINWTFLYLKYAVIAKLNRRIKILSKRPI